MHPAAKIDSSYLDLLGQFLILFAIIWVIFFYGKKEDDDNEKKDK